MDSSEKNITVEELFVHYAPELIRFLNQKLNNRERAEDIAQDAFIRMQRVRNLGQLKNPKAYLYQTAANLLIDEHRRERLSKAYLVEEQSSINGGETFDSASPERLLSAQQQMKRFEQALERMPENCRQAFLLNRINGLTYSEIAREMGVSVSSVEKYLISALKYCRHVLIDPA